MRTDDPKLAWSALDLLPQAVLVCQAGGAIVFRNLEATRSLPRGDHLGQVLRGSDPGELYWACDVASLPTEPGGVVYRNVSLAGAGGRRVLADVYLRALDSSLCQPSAEEGGPAVLVVVEDASLRASAQRRLAVCERLAAEGKVAARTAHEMNTPLDGVLRYIGLALRALEGKPRQAHQAKEHLAKAREGLLRMAGIIHDVLNESSGGHETLGSLLGEAVSAFAPRAEATGVTVACDLADAGDTGADARLFQVFCNVIKNALDAMPAGGVLTIHAHRVQGRCTVEFADTGCGLTDEQARRVFEPFYTTKPPGAGVGLGLAISREIVAALGGTIAAAPRPGGGAAIAITVPVRLRAAAVKGD
ncbi:MAG: HAMP domain-containing histidine kinase [Phycisphaerae bacterium]|nr:HAMP domain-containing histidine kinase [Phycisphaerae bacterium]